MEKGLKFFLKIGAHNITPFNFIISQQTLSSTLLTPFNFKTMHILWNLAKWLLSLTFAQILGMEYFHI
jgi:hypothetical protein